MYILNYGIQSFFFQLNLPESVSVDIVVSSIVDAGHIFMQQPTHPSFPSLERLNQFMNACYTQDGIVPQLPRPLEGKNVNSTLVRGNGYGYCVYRYSQQFFIYIVTT